MPHKKSQVQMVETIAILFIFFLMIGFGFIFYARIQKQSAKETMDKNLDLSSIEITQRVSFLPELQCSSKNVITDNCIDILKLDAVSNQLSTQQAQIDLYFDMFKYSNIIIRRVYPGIEKNWTLYSNTRGNSSSRFVPVPISLYNATSKTYELGVLEITHYS